MRRSIFSLLFIITAISIQAQFSIAPEFGINSSKYSLDEFTMLETIGKSNFYIGLHTKTKLNEQYALGFDVEYSRRGYGAISPASQDTFVIINDPVNEYRYSYLDFQPHLIYSLNQNISLGLGGYLGFNILEEANSVEQGWQNINDLQTISTIDYGLLVNARYTVNRLTLKLEYNLGMNDISNFAVTDANGNTIGGANQRLQNLQVGIGYYL